MDKPVIPLGLRGNRTKNIIQNPIVWFPNIGLYFTHYNFSYRLHADGLAFRATGRHAHKPLSKELDMKAPEKIDAREIRRKLGMNQSEFWSKIGVTQSGGSRYESGRNMPRPVQTLLRLVHVEQIDPAKVKREDFEVVEYLKSADPEMFKNLKKAARGARKKG